MTVYPDSSVYFAKCVALDGYDLKATKIGLSHDPEKRIPQVAAGQPFKCELIASVPGNLYLEYFLQIWLRGECLGGEFFYGEETTRITEYARKYGRTPFRVKEGREDIYFSKIDCLDYMARHGITFKDISKHSGVYAERYNDLLKREPWGNRRFLAALSVTAVKKGIPVKWPHDFLPREEKAAA